jgi:hypothetical protein
MEVASSTPAGNAHLNPSSQAPIAAIVLYSATYGRLDETEGGVRKTVTPLDCPELLAHIVQPI